MNESRILSEFPKGDPMASHLLAVAKQIESALVGTSWSIALAVQLLGSLSFQRFALPDGTPLNEDSLWESNIGTVEATMIVASLDPEDRGFDFWRFSHVGIDFDSEELLEADRTLRMALARAGIDVGE
jgi:hypothetical protein